MNNFKKLFGDGVDRLINNDSGSGENKRILSAIGLLIALIAMLLFGPVDGGPVIDPTPTPVETVQPTEEGRSGVPSQSSSAAPYPQISLPPAK